MQHWLIPYLPTIWAMGATGGLLLIQLLVLDLVALKASHRPGTPIEPDHRNFLFRAARAHANTNESIAGFILLSLFCVLSAAPAAWLNALSWGYVLARIAHMLCYYAGVHFLRSLSFAVGLTALFGMLVVGVLACAS